MTDLVQFVRARLDEVEAIARRAKDEIDDHAEASETSDEPCDYERLWRGYGRSAWTEREGAPISAHIARYDPARVLAEVAAKRRIVDRCAFAASWKGERARTPAELAWAILVDLAQPDADHPDYDPAWRASD